MNDSISRPGSGRHPVGLMVVVGLHVAIAAALMAGMKLRVTPTHVEPPVTVDTGHREKPREPDPLPPVHQMPAAVRDVEIPTFETNHPVTPDQPTYAHPDGVERSTDEPRPAVAGPGPVGPQPRPASLAKPARIDASAPACRPDYPAIAQREGATGVSRIRFTVDATGRVVHAATLASAGPTRAHRLLDRAAADALQACPITVGTDDQGRPVGTTVDVEYAWVTQP